MDEKELIKEYGAGPDGALAEAVCRAAGEEKWRRWQRHKERMERML